METCLWEQTWWTWQHPHPDCSSQPPPPFSPPWELKGGGDTAMAVATKKTPLREDRRWQRLVVDCTMQAIQGGQHTQVRRCG